MRGRYLNLRKSREERINEIHTAAKKVFSNKGYHGTSMEDIIAETSLSKGGFYHYYNDKKQIFYALMEQGTYYSIARVKMYKNGVSTQAEYLEAMKKSIMEDVFNYTEESKMYMNIISEIYCDKELFDCIKKLYEEYFDVLIYEIQCFFPHISKEEIDKKVKLTCYTLFGIGFYSKILQLDEMYKENINILEEIFDNGFNSFIQK
jgi:AcrR family transcriptional regulator